VDIPPVDLSDEYISQYLADYGEQERIKEKAYRAQRPALVVPPGVEFKTPEAKATYEQYQQMLAKSKDDFEIQLELRRKRPPVEWEEVDVPILPPEFMIGHNKAPSFWEAPVGHTIAWLRTRRRGPAPIYPVNEPDQQAVEDEALAKKQDLDDRYAIYLRNPKYAELEEIHKIPRKEWSPEQQKKFRQLWDELGKEAREKRETK